MRTFPPLAVDEADTGVLRTWIDAAVPPAARRARIVLLSGAGLGPSAVAEELGCSKQTVITWRERYRTLGLAGLRDAPRSGRPATVDPLAVVARTLDPPGPGVARWSTRTLAVELGISNVAVANVWRAWGVSPAAGGVRLAAEPALERGVAAVRGLYLGRGTRVLVLQLDDGAPAASRETSARRAAAGCLPGIDARPQADALPAFLGRLGPRRPLALLVDGATGEVHRWADARRGVSVHAVPPTVAWARLARSACLAAAGNPCGAASVAAVRTALAEQVGEGAFGWTLSGAGSGAGSGGIHVAGSA